MESSNGGSNTSQDSPSFPGTSFAQAVNQLDQQAIPTQTLHPPLVPSSSPAPSSSASSFLAHDGAPPTAAQQLQFPIDFSPTLSATTSVAVVSSPPQLPPSSTSSTPPTTGTLPQPPQLSAAAYYGMLSKKIRHQFLSGWSPRHMSPEEVNEYRLTTQRLIERIHLLEGQQARMRPIVDPRLEQALFVARANYRARFPRTFRVNDLPTEIFTNILRLVCWSTLDPRSSFRERLTVTSTCRHWRAIAVADNVLWNAILFSDYPKYERSFEWLARSGNATTDIRISDTKEKPWTITLARDIIGKLFTKLSLIRVLVITLEDWDPLLYILDALQIVKEQNLPMIMERLEVHRTGPEHLQIGEAYPSEIYMRSFPLFGGADVPTFNYLTLHAVHIDWTQSSLKGLHTLDIRRVAMEHVPSLQTFRKILTNSPNLCKLVLNRAGPVWPPNPYVTLAPIELPTLRTLLLGDFGSLYIAYTASQFTCTNVVNLTIMNALQADYSLFWHLLTGRLPSLRVLSLYGVDLFDNSPLVRMTFLKWLKSIPKLSFLRVGGVTTVIMDLLLYDIRSMQSVAKGSGSSLTGAEPTSHPACPELTILEFHGMETDYMARWVTARKEMGVPVQKIYVGEQTKKNTSPEDRQKLILVMRGSSGGIHLLDSISVPVEEQLLTDLYPAT